ncbi:MAG: hypothetical protein J0M04_10795 [Verrucomicrobia bacterium]|nr:hypothetical protein [Verrucomicrobiota bacterium]
MIDSTQLSICHAATMSFRPRHNHKMAFAIVAALAVGVSVIAALWLAWRRTAPLTMVECSAIVKVDEESDRAMIESALPPLDSDQNDMLSADRPVVCASDGNIGRYKLLRMSVHREFDCDSAAAVLRRIDDCISGYCPMSAVPVSFEPNRRMVILLNAKNDPVAFVGSMDYENWIFVSRALRIESKDICAVDMRRKGSYCYVNDPILFRLLFESP